MNTRTIVTKIFNPNIEASITVGIFDSVEEALELLGKERVLEIINKNAVNAAKTSWNQRIVKELMRR